MVDDGNFRRPGLSEYGQGQGNHWKPMVVLLEASWFLKAIFKMIYLQRSTAGKVFLISAVEGHPVQQCKSS